MGMFDGAEDNIRGRLLPSPGFVEEKSGFGEGSRARSVTSFMRWKGSVEVDEEGTKFNGKTDGGK